MDGFLVAAAEDHFIFGGAIGFGGRGAGCHPEGQFIIPGAIGVGEHLVDFSRGHIIHPGLLCSGLILCEEGGGGEDGEAKEQQTFHD